MDRTLVLLKPDAIQRGLIGELTTRMERKGFKIIALKLMAISKSLAENHYAPHVEQPFFKNLVGFITSSPIVAMVLEGENVVDSVRTMMGATDPGAADTGTIRGDYATDIGMNLIHGSDSLDSSQREIDLFFKSDEILDYTRAVDAWVSDK